MKTFFGDVSSKVSSVVGSRLGRTIAIGAGVGILGVQSSTFIQRMVGFGFTKEEQELVNILTEMRNGGQYTDIIDDAAFADKVCFYEELKMFPAAAIALRLNHGVRDMCERMYPYSEESPTSFIRFLNGAATYSLIKLELDMKWRPWTFEMPRLLHAATFEMLMATRELRQCISRRRIDHLADFDDIIASEISQFHNESISNSLLDARDNFESSVSRKKRMFL